MGQPSQITVTGVDNSLWTISGQGCGYEGVELFTSPTGFYDAPITSIWNSTAFQTGATFGGYRTNKRDLVFGVNIFKTKGQHWEQVDSAWRKAWAYDADSTLTITTETGSRSLQLRMSEQPEFTPIHDPHIKAWGRVIMTCTAGVPWWTENDYTQVWVSPANTIPGTSFQLGDVAVENPTDQPMWLEWVCSAPAQWTLPDFSFGLDYYDGLGSGARNTDRIITLPYSGPGQDLTVDTDPSQEMIVSADGSNFWAAMNGVSFLYPIPPYTESIDLPVSVSFAPAGASVMAVQHRNWSRPYGMQ